MNFGGLQKHYIEMTLQITLLVEIFQIQIDESHFFKPKYNVGRMLIQPAVWVFRILDMNSNRLLMEVVPQRDAQILLSIFQSTVLKVTTFWSDQCHAYITLPSIGYPHQTMNHSIEFVAQNGVNTQRIEVATEFLPKPI